MKKITRSLKHLILGALVVGSLNSCNRDYFDTQPETGLTIESIFQNRSQTQRWWAGLFTEIPSYWNAPYVNYFPNSTDELDASNWTVPTIVSGGLTPSQATARWLKTYEMVRLSTIFMQNVGKNQEILALNDGDQIIKRYKAEARFLRAYYYWLLMKQVGPVVIMSGEVNVDEEIDPANYQIPRSSWDECVAYVLSEMDKAKANLPADYSYGTDLPDNPVEVGRINKIIVQAVQSEILLYHASPLFNGNTALGALRNPGDGKQLFNQTYDPSRWTKAATAAKKAIDMAEAEGKHLFVKPDADPFKQAYLSVRNLFWDGWDEEGIWIRPAGDSWWWSIRAAPRSIQGTAYNGLAVVLSLVDAFRMDNGKSIQDDPRYNETTFASTDTDYYAAGTNTMNTHREARYYAFITFTGSPTPGKAKEDEEVVEFFYTGNSGKSGAPRDWPKTGYTARKNIHPTYSKSPAVNPDRPDMIIRLAELYLNYAEALNEANPGHPDIAKYLNKVRNRAGLPDVATGLSQDEMRQQIRTERRIELCFEGSHRFFDVRRWKITNQPGSNQGGAFYGLNMDKGTSISDPEFYERVVAFVRTPWQNKYYFLPIPQNVMDRNKTLVQNLGY